MRMWAQALTGVVLACAHPHRAAAGQPADAPQEEGPPGRARPWRGAVGAGGYLAVTGPATTGALATAELFPGGAAGRFGVRLEGRALDPDGPGELDAGLVTAGVIYEAAAARPRLALALHAELGAALPDPRAVVGGGVRTQLWIVGPLALGLDSTATLILDGLDTELALAGALTLGLAR